jgi:ribosomal protein S18 acetylase RimI-like enzyme
MNENLRIRPATLADIPAMLPVINDAFAIESFLVGNRTYAAQLTDMMQKGSFLLGFAGAGELVASVFVKAQNRRGYFGMLAVAPAQQGKGFAREMVTAAEDYCRQHGCTAMDLTVLSLRPELPSLYSKFGYVESGIEEFHPTRPLKPGVECHCILMSKTL